MKHEIFINTLGLKNCKCGSRTFVNGKCAFDKNKDNKDNKSNASLLTHAIASLNAGFKETR